MKSVIKPDFKRLAVAVAWTGVIIFAAFQIVSQQIQINDYKSQIAKLDDSVKTLEERKSELETQSDLYSSDEYIESVARTKLGYVRSDEVVFKQAED
jgi:cell division protein FtsB